MASSSSSVDVGGEQNCTGGDAFFTTEVEASPFDLLSMPSLEQIRAFLISDDTFDLAAAGCSVDSTMRRTASCKLLLKVAVDSTTPTSSHDWLGASGSPQNTSPFLSSGPAIGTQPSSYRAPPPFMRIFSSSHASSSSYWSVTHASKWNFSSSVPNSVVPMGPPPQSSSQLQSRSNMPPSSGSVFSAPRTPPQPLLQGYSNVPQRANVPPFQPDSQFQASRPVSQPLMQAYPAAHVPPHTSQYHAHQSLVPPPPPVGGPMGFSSREQLQHPLTGPPIVGSVQGLVEEFQSLTVGSVPGALDPEVESLPRPLNGDEEPTKILEVYPFNCHLRFMRLTTHAIPNSQSLLSRWHLPLGAVVHPLAEAPDGASFGAKMRTYVNPYVTFTDAGRKWRCNLCSLLNDVILILQFPVYTSICFTLILHEMITGLSRK
ncbi:protein transport protein Sec24-like [Musa troglodytarum]|uniref:Protein transport protein Sec24-like n=1 Tax=Musa troglodytarum TaxID=320322 RepID=A0A9E7KM32_9LILI|nr:protein transport protein Sec24-like [Musa troglodytarum]